MTLVLNLKLCVIVASDLLLIRWASVRREDLYYILIVFHDHQLAMSNLITNIRELVTF